MVPKVERFEMRVDEALLARVDAWRATQGGVPARSEAIRQLVELGLRNFEPKRTIQLTDGEKLIATMLCDVYKTLNVEGDIDPDFITGVIAGGHMWAPKWELQGLFHDHEDDPREVSFVVNVLDMWTFLEEGYAALSKAEQAKVDKSGGLFKKPLQFPGFDGNNEPTYMSIARFLIEDMERFTRFGKKRSLNSHFPMVDRYRPMVALFEPVRTTLVGVKLTAEQIVQILDVGR